MLNDRLILPSQCFQNKLVFTSLWIRVLLFPLHFVLMRAAIWFHCLLKHDESNFLCKKAELFYLSMKLQQWRIASSPKDREKLLEEKLQISESKFPVPIILILGHTASLTFQSFCSALPKLFWCHHLTVVLGLAHS